MISKTIKIGLFALAVCSVTFVDAQNKKEKKGRSPEKMFANLDADANGSISLEEYKAKRMKDDTKEGQLEKRFAKMDIDKNGSIDIDEFTISLKKMKENKDKKNKQ